MVSILFFLELNKKETLLAKYANKHADLYLFSSSCDYSNKWINKQREPAKAWWFYMKEGVHFPLANTIYGGCHVTGYMLQEQTFFLKGSILSSGKYLISSL